MPRRKVQEEKKSSSKDQKLYQIDVLDVEGKVVGKLDLPEKIFAAPINQKLMAQAVRVYLANQRQGTLKTKSRGEIRASTIKIYRQKGTGRARHGAISAPIFVGGGIAHGPKPRDFSLKMAQKMRHAALFSALSDRMQGKAISAVKGLENVKPKTKEMAQVLRNLKIGPDPKKQTKILLVLPKKLENLERATRNIEDLTVAQAALLNTHLVLDHQKLLFLPESLAVLEKTFLKSRQKKVALDEKKSGD